ncbi:hypothetical protein H5410_020856 [Solanum commersonii]|uniref:Uncharacterized protein n=1 Tax=Solanum commersonii TaxID=4109 RepID=A0A9J5ZCB9_SOLCO|nr:hypothetical protein H5410_020856 [Solanum commersonii]
MAKQLWDCRWFKCGYLEAQGACGGIVILWDSRVWKGELVTKGTYSISYKFEAVQESFNRCLTRVYAPHTRVDKNDCWEEILVAKGLMKGPWVSCGYFNTIKHIVEKRNCSRITNIMRDFSEWIEDMWLHDPHLNSGKFTWFKEINHYSMARLDIFLFYNDTEEAFKDIRQRILPRANSDHTPISLDCGNWNHKKSYFKFENWWLGVSGSKVWSRNSDTRQLNEDEMMMRLRNLPKCRCELETKIKSIVA